MATTPLGSALAASPSDSDKARHLLALLLSLGRPTRPSELAARCSAFPATAHLVQRLCSVANSPLSLSDDLLVTPSLLAVADGGLSTDSGKRKRFVLDCGFVPSVKRRLIVDFENVNEDNGARKSVICFPPKIHIYMTDYLGRRINMQTSDVTEGLDKPIFSSPFFIEDSAGPSSCGAKSIDNVEDKIDQMETDIILQRDSVDNLEPIVPTMARDLVIYNETSYHEINSLANSCLDKSKERITSPVVDENSIASCKLANSTFFEDERVVGDSEEELIVNPGNDNGKTEDMSQPNGAISNKLHGIDSGGLGEEDYEDTIPKRLIRVLEARTRLPVTGFSVDEMQFLLPSEKVSNDSVLYERANMHENTKENRISPALDKKVRCKVTHTTILEDVRTVGKDEEEVLIDPGNPNGEIENLSQPYAAVSDEQSGIGCKRLKEEDVEETKPLHKKEMKRYSIMPALDESVSGIYKGMNATVLDDRRIVEDADNGLLLPSIPNGETDVLCQPYTGISDKPPGNELNETQTTYFSTEFNVPQKQLLKSAATMKVFHKDKISSRLQSLNGYSLEQDQAVVTPKVSLHLKVDQKTNSMPHRSKEICGDMHIKERKRRYKSIASKDQPEKKELPKFDSYKVEEEEGSGGYGTVYRARSNNERTRVAIKCPHANAHKSHVNNELRMLERFGMKAVSRCFVLQHVEHDRPEVLKKEIDVCGLRWYGYCLFRALASLHKQGVVHRDVKPGNFLFSQKANKGYLIDFNLSTDLHQKYGNISKSSGGFDVNSKDEKLMTAKSSPPITLRKLPSGKSLLTANGETSKSLKSTFDMKDLKKMAFSQMKDNKYSGGRKIIKSQGADGSVITSVKDVTSTRTLSVERMREPLPCQGRKELINLVQEARESPNHEASSISALLRKRVPAPPINVDGKLFHVTPMPMHSKTNGIGGPCLIRSKGLGKQKEGPCAGTKGFRAPEVLLRSPHQGPKIDLWSAGVTLLYLLIGRTPFLGEPELNIKDIAKLRGSEDIWEVAKLHDRESSFPVELYNTDFLPSLKLKDWCRENTKRPELFEEIPRPLFDLVDKCLMVNPRVRISAEEALKHEFFAPCHEELRKHRLQRQVS